MPAESSTRTLIDTGPIVASLDTRDPHHEACVAAFKTVGPAFTCWPVITEALYLLGNYSKATGMLFESLRSGAYQLLSLGNDDLDGIERIMAKYADQGFQLADASLMHLAERESIEQVLTIDQTDFGLYRTPQGKSLTLLPE